MSRTSKGFIWSFVERFSTQGISFVLSIIIARLVAPEAYGVIALIQIFISFANVFIDSGFGNALIQKKNRREEDYHTVFIFNIAISSFLYLILYFCAPSIAAFYENSQLIVITRCIGLNLIISSLSIVQRTRLTINLDFKTQSKASLMAVIVSGIVGVVMAYMRFEVWALIAQQLTSQTLNAVLLMYVSRWTPQFVFSFKSFKGLFKFGSKLLLSNLITNIYLNIYNIVIGKWYSVSSLAYYNRAFTLTQFPSTNIETILQRVIYPLTCEVQNDNEKLRSVYFRYLHFSHFIILPLMMLMCVLAAPLVVVILTDKWLPAAEYISIYSVNFMLYAWQDQSGSLINAVGRSDLGLQSTFIKRPISFLVLLVTIHYGVRIICYGVLFNTLIETIINLFYCRRVIGIKLSEHLKSQFDVIAATILIGVITWGVSCIMPNVYFQLFVGSIVGITSYIILVYVLRLQERELITGIYKSLRKKVFHGN